MYTFNVVPSSIKIVRLQVYFYYFGISILYLLHKVHLKHVST